MYERKAEDVGDTMDFNEASSHVRTSAVLTGRLSRRSVFMYLMRFAQGLILSEAPVAATMVMLLQRRNGVRKLVSLSMRYQ